MFLMSERAIRCEFLTNLSHRCLGKTGESVLFVM